MDKATLELTRTWLVKARADLGSARKLADGPDAYPDVAIYHCQLQSNSMHSSWRYFPKKYIHNQIDRNKI